MVGLRIRLAASTCWAYTILGVHCLAVQGMYKTPQYDCCLTRAYWSLACLPLSLSCRAATYQVDLCSICRALPARAAGQSPAQRAIHPVAKALLASTSRCADQLGAPEQPSRRARVPDKKFNSVDN